MKDALPTLIAAALLISDRDAPKPMLPDANLLDLRNGRQKDD
jgi:hypothetical protein